LPLWIFVPDFDLHQWFGREELEPCPACQERAGIRLPTSGTFLCVACGHVGAEALPKPDDSPLEKDAKAR
jgi:hypothetical protein